MDPISLTLGTLAAAGTLAALPSAIESGWNAYDKMSGEKAKRIQRMLDASGRSSAMMGVDQSRDLLDMQGESGLIDVLERTPKAKPRRYTEDVAEQMFLESLMRENQTQMGMMAARFQGPLPEESFVNRLMAQSEGVLG